MGFMSRKSLGSRHTGRANEDRTATILHADMDAFFVSVELLERPELVGRQVIVGGTGGRGVVSSASYEARALGVHAAMPMSRALQLAPQATVIPGHMHKYRAASTRVMEIFRDFTPLVEPLSIDEAFLDITGAMKLFGSPAQIGELIRERIRAELGLPCSIGAASTKFVAKLASGKSKPNGLLVIPHDQTVPFLHALNIGAIWGVGATTERKLHSRGIHTVFELAHTPKPVLERLVGKAMADHLHELSWGRDPRPVVTERQEKSVSHEQTFATDIGDHEELLLEVRAQADAVAARLRKVGLVAGTVAVKVRWSSFETITRQVRLERPSNTGLTLYRAAAELFDGLHPQGRPVRLIGVRADSLSAAGEATALTLWDEQHRDEWDAAEQAVDAATAKFGRGVLRPASLLGRGERRDGETGLSDRPNRDSTPD